MTGKSITDALMAKVAELRRGPETVWRYPRRAPKNPLKAVPGTSWATWPSGGTQVIKKNEKNWFYADVQFPERKHGVNLAGTEGRLFINCWVPFTLWLDGREVFKETHVWHATGPIADPVVKAIEPGRKYRLVVCIEPTELPEFFNPLGFSFSSKACADLALELSAAAFQLRYAEALAENAEELKAVENAAGKLDVDAVGANRWKRARASIEAMEAELAWLSKRAADLTVHLVGHAHIDMDWLWTWPDTVHCVRRDFKAVTDMMDEYPDLTFTHSQIPTYEIVKKMDPDVYKKMKRRIAEGRWENAAGTWVEGDLNMADGESIARHMLYAADWGKANLGTQAKVLWEPDTFGHPANMPQLAALGEHDCYFHMRCNPGAQDNWPVRQWEGVDGTKITTFSQNYSASLQPGDIIYRVLEARRFGLRNVLHVWGIGDHGGALSRRQMELLDSYRDKPVMPTFTFSTIRRLLEAVEEEKPKLPTNKGFTYNLFEGCFTTHASIKEYNRRCEGALLTAEALSALAGLDKRSTLRNAWTDMLFNHFHDIMDGAAVHDSYINAHSRAESSLKKAEHVTRQAAKLLAKPARNGRKLVVINQLGFERTQPVSAALPKSAACLIDSDGKAVPIQRKGAECVFIAEKIPAFSSKVYSISDKAPRGLDDNAVCVTEESGGYYMVETPLARAMIKKDSGAIGYYFDKALGRELVAHGVPKHMTYMHAARADLALNVFQIIDEAPNGMSAWLINDILKQENLLRGAEVALVDAGPVFGLLRVTHKFRSSKIEEDIVFYKELGRVDFEATIDWREKGSAEVGVPQLKVSFAAAMSAARARFEGPFVVTEHPADGTEYSTQKWVDVSGEDFGFTLYNDSKYGCDALGGRLRMTLLRNAYGPDPESDNGVHRVRFAFQPHGPGAENADLIRAATGFNRPPVCVRSNVPNAAAALPGLAMEGAQSVVCTALRKAEHSDDLMIRFFEASGRRRSMTFSLGDGISCAKEVNFLENPIGRRVKILRGRVSVRFRPYEVKTLLVKCEGLGS
ncbi:MAG: hypothetical protein HQ592_03125 [Planctomycetes bacterium]|nr:hypothetical protein [Planctomycetota bacterium]